jgi:hypothetical protein
MPADRGVRVGFGKATPMLHPAAQINESHQRRMQKGRILPRPDLARDAIGWGVAKSFI